jgi:hypothetical protein
MVYIDEVGNGRKAVWFDGRIPSHQAMLHGRRRSRLHELGLDTEVVQKYSLSDRNTCQSKPRTDLYADLIAAYIESHLNAAAIPRTEYKLAITQPKWDRNNKPEAVRLAERTVFQPRDDQLPEDDPLFAEIPSSDILHVRPYIPRTPETEFYQTIAVYHMIQGEPAHGPIERFCFDFDSNDAPRFDYHNFPVFEDHVRSLLHGWLFAQHYKDCIEKVLPHYNLRLVAHRPLRK